MAVVGIAEAKNADVITALEAMLADAKTGALVGLCAVVSMANGEALQVVDGELTDPAAVIGQLHIMATQQAMIEAADNLSEADDEE